MAVTIDFSEDVQARLDKLSAQNGQHAVDYAREALEERLAQIEWECEVAARAEAVRAGLVETRPFDELVREVGLDPGELRAEAEVRAKAKAARKDQAA